MRERASVSAAPATDDVGSGALFIITLNSSTAPMALEVPTLPELAGLAVFRSRKVEDGRDRFRLHLGYFESTDAAESVLPAVREHFPAAWVGPAPQSGMGSLDDTSVAQFKFIKAPNTIKSNGSTSTRLRALTATPVAPRAASTSSSPAPAPLAQGAKPAIKVSASGNRPAPAAARVSGRTRASKNAAGNEAARGKAMAGPEVLSLLESAPSTPPPTKRVEMQPRERAAVIGAIQRFAVQLVWSTEPVNLTEVPKLAIFDAYTLYKVQVDRAGRRWYGLRLGFFADPVSARQVSLYARSDFSAAAVVPVSDRECDRAAQAAVKELPDAVPTPKAELHMELIDVPRTTPTAGRNTDPRTVAKPAPSAVARTAAPAKAPAPKAAAKTSEPVKVDKSPRDKSSAELAADLPTEPTFELDNREDPLNDTGVRHLAITVVKRKPKLGRMFKRGSRRS